VQPWASCWHTCASVNKQYNLVPANERWCLAAGKVTVGLASHWPHVTDISGSAPAGSRPRRGRWAIAYALFVEYDELYLTRSNESDGSVTAWHCLVSSLPVAACQHGLGSVQQLIVQNNFLRRCVKLGYYSSNDSPTITSLPTMQRTLSSKASSETLNMYCSLVWKSDLRCTTTSETDLESTRLWLRKLWTSMADFIVHNLYQVSYWTHSDIYIVTAFCNFSFCATLCTVSFLRLLFDVFTTVIKLCMLAWSINGNDADDEGDEDDDDESKLSVLIYNCLSPPCPHCHRSASTSTLTVTSTRRSTIGDRAFPVAAACAWNSLLSSVRTVSSLNAFRDDLKTVLFRASFDDRTWLLPFSLTTDTCNL